MQESSNSRNDGHGLWSYDLLEQVCAPLGPLPRPAADAVDGPSDTDALTVSVAVAHRLSGD